MNNLVRLAALATVFIASGCASNRCDDVQPYQGISETELLKIPEGVSAPADTGEYRIPAGQTRESRGCLAEPPMTLPAEALEDPDDAESDDPEPAGAETSGEKP